jgi:hypothetical protein
MTCSACTEDRTHARGLCRRCYDQRPEKQHRRGSDRTAKRIAYMRAYHQKPESKERRRQYIERNREAVLESYRKYNAKRSPLRKNAPYRPRAQAIVRVPVKGWGCVA